MFAALRAFFVLHSHVLHIVHGQQTVEKDRLMQAAPPPLTPTIKFCRDAFYIILTKFCAAVAWSGVELMKVTCIGHFNGEKLAFVSDFRLKKSFPKCRQNGPEKASFGKG